MFEIISRENVGQYVVGEIGRPKWRDARVKVVEVNGRRAILKDVYGRCLFFRWTFGRHLIAREFKAYRALAGIEGVPRAYRMLDADGFVCEYIDGAPLTAKKVREELDVPPDFYDRCFDVVRAMHKRGVVHMDLRNKRNILFAEGGRPYIVDFASAIRLPSWMPFRRRLLAVLGAFDRAGVLKLKQKVAGHLLSDEEEASLRRSERTRAIFFPHVLVLQAIRRFARNRRKAKQKDGAP